VVHGHEQALDQGGHPEDAVHLGPHRGWGRAPARRRSRKRGAGNEASAFGLREGRTSEEEEQSAQTHGPPALARGV
jgi:hypothetical protein